ncbi:MAG TPA: hypothetical protein VE988_26665, partial [Gemmataceae bacterium]|nr:hypothetical protein [Gemmataceae bacterium]
MLAQTLDILQRTKALLADQSNWFETIGHWYKTTTLPRKLIIDLLKSNRGRDRVLVAANGHNMAAVSGVTDTAARRITWLLPSNRVLPGPNSVAVHLDPNAACPMILRAVSIEQDYHLAWQSVFLTDPE